MISTIKIVYYLKNIITRYKGKFYMHQSHLLLFILLNFIDKYCINTFQKTLNILKTKQYSNIIKINITNIYRIRRCPVPLCLVYM